MSATEAPAPAARLGLLAQRRDLDPWRARSALRSALRALPAPTDAIAPFVRLLLALRWGALSLSLVIAMAEHRGSHSAVAAAVLACYTLWRTVRPINYSRGGWAVAAPLLLEVLLCVGAVEFTGFGGSPFLVSLVAATLIAGFAGGLRLISGLAVIAAISVALPDVLLVSHRPMAGDTIQFAVELALIGLVGGYTRHLLLDAVRAENGLTQRVDDLVELNRLLVELHGATERAAMPLDIDSVVDWTLARSRESFGPDLANVLLYDAADDSWRVAGSEAVSSGGIRTTASLPRLLVDAAFGEAPVPVPHLTEGFSYKAQSGLYCPLRASGELVGLLVLEFFGPRVFNEADVRRATELATAASLALESARWLKRLYTVAVEQERARLARELHDHIGQSVVYLGFELDRLTDQNAGRAVQKDLAALRGDLRSVVTELRDTLVDLRNDVSEDRDMGTVIRAFVDRMSRREAVHIEFTDLSDGRLPVPVEREFWRVAQEAVVNAVKHSRGAKITILWSCHDGNAILEVVDDGIGINRSPRRAPSGFGLVGMRERADAVGALLEIHSAPGSGTVVRMTKKASVVV